jgi:hypothetical protein
MMKIVLSLALLGFASAACPNGCSGHGTCGFDDACTCYQDWVMGDQDGGDCSDRKCPYEISWVSSPNADGYVHTYAECAGRGICDRSSGECDCFDGFTGKACAYTTCPNDCSGHGTCEYIEELTVPGTFFDKQFQGFHTKSVSLAFVSELWDYGKTRTCVCDPTYTEVDCSRKMCPKGNDVLDTRMDTTDKLLYQVQNLTFEMQWDEKKEAKTLVSNATFSLSFKSTINETFTTIPIRLDLYQPDKTAKSMETELLKLPNGVVDGISVNSTMKKGLQDLDGHRVISFLVYFSGTSVSGPQNLLIVDTAQCGAGCTPQLTGVDVKSYGSELSYVTEAIAADYNNYECGRRGKCDYDSGLCDCFEGYTGYKCQVQTALI